MPDKNNISSRLENMLREEAQKHKSEKKNSLREANDKYISSVKSGVIKERGYTLRGIEDGYRFVTYFNQ